MLDDDIIEVWQNGLILRLRERLAGDYDDNEAERVIRDYFDEQREVYGGNAVWLYRGCRTKHRPAQIRLIQAEYNGRNQSYLIKKYGISKSTLRRYLKK